MPLLITTGGEYKQFPEKPPRRRLKNTLKCGIELSIEQLRIRDPLVAQKRAIIQCRKMFCKMNRKKQGKIAAVIIMLKDDEKAGHLVALELSRVHGKAVNYNEAEKYASQEYKIRPGNIDVNHALAWISFKKNEMAKASEYIRNALKTGSRDPEIVQRALLIEKSKG